MIKKTTRFSFFIVVSMILMMHNAWSMMCSDDPDTLIPDDSINTGASDANPGSPGSITIDVPAGAVGTISDLDFQLAIDSTYVGDLIVTLTSPANTTVTLIDRPGRADDGSGGGGFGCSRNDIDTTLDDSAGTAAEGQCINATPTITGTLSPTGNLSDFNGESLSGTWTLTATDFFPADQGTFISASNCLSVTTTPVTVSSVKTRKRGKSLIFDWQTDSEAFNLGFHLWGMVDGQWQQLNKRLLAAGSVDSLTPTNYRKRINLLRLEGDITEVGLSALSTSGQEDFYGPFQIGESYGEESVPKKIDWVDVRKQYDEARIAAGYIKINNRWVVNTKSRQRRQLRKSNRYQDVVLSISDSGVYRVSYEQLLAQGINLSGMKVNKLAITNNGNAVPRIVNVASGSKQFGPGSEIIFYATGPNEGAARYVDNSRYRITFDGALVLNVPLSKQALVTSELRGNTHRSVIEFGDKNAYLFALPGENPWYDTSIRAFGQTARHTIDVDIPTTAMLDESTELALSLVGGFEFALIDADGDGDVEPNHHFRVYLNRDAFAEPIYEGYSNALDAVNIVVSNTGQLVHGNNVIEIELIPDNGYNVDAVYYLGGTLRYVEANVFNSASVSFAVEGDEPLIEFIDQSQQLNSAYSVDTDGNFSEIALTRIGVDVVRLNSPINPSLTTTPSLWLASDAGYLQVDEIFRLTEPEQESLSLVDVDYVVIADPSLIGDDLDRFAQQQESLGRHVKIVNTEHIFNKYADGLVVPYAIADYLTEQSSLSEFKYVLLVGGHTYNYRAYNVTPGQEPITMIPSFYRSADFLSKQIPTAVPFVDFDNDGFPDRAIGRWPVRDLAQLKNVVDKTITWHSQGSHKDSKSSLFIADIQDNSNDFTGSSDRLIRELGLDSDPWPQPNTVYSDSIAADTTVPANQRLAAARDALVDGVNNGPALTVYSGHGAPVTWGTQRLLNASVAERFDNVDAPSLMIPLACYTTYYETPGVKSLSELLLTDSDSGAVALSGATLLSSTLDNENFMRGILKDMTVSGVDLGTAVLQMKQRMKGSSSIANQASGLGKAALVYNWVTLGDPTLSFGLPDVTPQIIDEVSDKSRVP